MDTLEWQPARHKPLPDDVGHTPDNPIYLAVKDKVFRVRPSIYRHGHCIICGGDAIDIHPDDCTIVIDGREHSGGLCSNLVITD